MKPNFIYIIIILSLIVNNSLVCNEKISFGLGGDYKYFSSSVSPDLKCLYYDCNEEFTTNSSIGYGAFIHINYDISEKINLSLHTGINIQSQSYNGYKYLGKVYDDNFNLVDATFNDDITTNIFALSLSPGVSYEIYNGLHIGLFFNSLIPLTDDFSADRSFDAPQNVSLQNPDGDSISLQIIPIKRYYLVFHR